jgi:hypothetical protein
MKIITTIAIRIASKAGEHLTKENIKSAAKWAAGVLIGAAADEAGRRIRSHMKNRRASC